MAGTPQTAIESGQPPSPRAAAMDGGCFRFHKHEKSKGHGIASKR